MGGETTNKQPEDDLDMMWYRFYADASELVFHGNGADAVKDEESLIADSSTFETKPAESA